MGFFFIYYYYITVKLQANFIPTFVFYCILSPISQNNNVRMKTDFGHKEKYDTNK